MTSAGWQLQSKTASLTAAGWQLKFELDRPQLGIDSLSTVGDVHCNTFKVFGADQDAHRVLVEFYQRDQDLIATYAAAEFPDARSQILWRFHPSKNNHFLTLEVVVSVQTHVLHTVPKTMVESEVLGHHQLLPAPESRDLLPNLRAVAADALADRTDSYLFQLGPQQSYCEFIHPLDLATSGAKLILPAGATEVACLRRELFVRPLEKGVILRSRLLGLYCSTSLPLEAACKEYLRFSNSDPTINA
jgi:hypothetical protein